MSDMTRSTQPGDTSRLGIHATIRITHVIRRAGDPAAPNVYAPILGYPLLCIGEAVECGGDPADYAGAWTWTEDDRDPHVGRGGWHRMGLADIERYLAARCLPLDAETRAAWRRCLSAVPKARECAAV